MEKDHFAEKKTDTEHSIKIWLAAAITLIIFGFAAAAFGLGRMVADPNGPAFSLANLSAYGSFLQGAVGSLWSLAGLMLIYVAFLGQKLQLLNQHAELEDQQDQFRLQQESLKRQNFEAYFFQLLNFQREVTAQLRYGTTDVIADRGVRETEGKACFAPLLSDIKASWMRTRDLMKGKTRRELENALTPEQNELFEKEAHDYTQLEMERIAKNSNWDESHLGFLKERVYHDALRERINNAIDLVLPKRVNETSISKLFVNEWSTGVTTDNSKYLGHYFRTLYHIFKFVKESDIPESEKRRYTSLARAQLSADELVLLFYNCLTPLGTKFKPLVEEFGLFEHLDIGTLFEREHKGLYLDPAYI